MSYHYLGVISVDMMAPFAPSVEHISIMPLRSVHQQNAIAGYLCTQPLMT